MHRVLELELELEQTNNDCAVYEITITIINMGRKFRGRFLVVVVATADDNDDNDDDNVDGDDGECTDDVSEVH